MSSKFYTRKPVGGPKGTFNAYKWKPDTTIKKKGSGTGLSQNKFKKDIINFCNATAGSNGIDNVVGYVAQPITNEKGVNNNYAYIACNYVK